MNHFSDAELSAFFDEALSPTRCAQLEHELRSNTHLRQRLIEVRGRESAGLHTLGAIWRRNRLSCPDRSELGQFVLGTLETEQKDYIQFHLQKIGCRYCQANLADIDPAEQTPEQATTRRNRYFQTSAGYLKKD
ncbi:MAG: hypothetical protein L7W43_11190 [Rubripirellula sp.]|nr:hypothetical protein [Rhodopirellula sp.]MCH1440213.1 hypothetical protein [Rubripirellula sp.]OUX08677.1 MAG: hypothetical protein CBE00_01380 [Planctomycetaceae bacterium TMED240]